MNKTEKKLNFIEKILETSEPKDIEKELDIYIDVKKNSFEKK